MALFSSDVLNPGVQRRELFGWAMYDFANSGYTTVVITAVFAAYFMGGVAGGADWAPLAWTVAVSISYVIVMLTMPSLGAWADLHGAKKKLLIWSTAGCVVATAAMALVRPGGVLLAMVLIIVSNTFYSYGESLTAAFLPELARPEAMGKVSGWGWGFGYLGGMLTLAGCLAYVLHYAEQVIGFLPQETMVLILVLNVAAAAGAFGGGHLQDRIGHKLTLGLTLLGWIATCVIAALAATKGQFWVAATIAGLSMGSCQSVGRAMVGLFAPRAQLAEFFGLWSFATRLASIVGPLAYGLITWGTGGNQRVAIACTTLLFVLGLMALAPIDVVRGRAMGQQKL